MDPSLPAATVALGSPDINAGSTMSPTDPMSVADSPVYRDRSEAEHVAYLQEDGVGHHAMGWHSHGSGGAECCEGIHGRSNSHSAMEAAHDKSKSKPLVVTRSIADQHRLNRFSSIFSQEAAAMTEARREGQDHSSASTSSATATATHDSSDSMNSSERETEALSHYHVQLEAEEEMQRFLAQNTIRSIHRLTTKADAEAAGASGASGGTPSSTASCSTDPHSKTRLRPTEGYRGVQALLDYNKQWAAEVSRFNPRYFIELAKEQKPEYLWIGCSDSRVPANEVIGLHPGDVFVHRNIGNIFSLSDLNCLSALQFAVDCLKVQHVIIAGHYKCGAVTAAMEGATLGLADHWIMQVTDIKNKWWDRVVADIPQQFHLSVLCELNVLEQLSHVVNCRVVQRRWQHQNANDRYYGRTENTVYVRPAYATAHLTEKRIRSNLPSTVVNYNEELEVHGWVYSLDDGQLRPLLTLTRHSNVKKLINNAIEAVFVRYTQLF